MKNQFLDEIHKLAEDVEVRLDWVKDTYPDAESTDAEMWAWEFLRRNRHYVRDYAYYALEKENESHEKLAVAWGVSRLANPCLTYAELRAEDAVVESIFEFEGSHVYIDFPRFYKGEFIEQSNVNGTGVHGASEHTILLAPNQVVAVFNLDGNIDSQIDSLRTQLKHSKIPGQSTRNTRSIIFETDSPKNHSLGEDEVYLVWYEQEYPAVRVHLSHLWLALRCVDAMGKLKPKTTTVVSSKLFIDQLLTQFNTELMTGQSAAASMKKDPHENWRRQEIVDALRFGLRYSLSKRHITVASTDLNIQANKSRAIKKKRLQ